MFDVQNMGYKMHYARVLEMYNDICNKFGAQKAPEVKLVEEKDVPFVTKYVTVRDNFKKAVKEVVIPSWENMMPQYFENNKIEEAKEIMHISFEMLPEDSYDLFTRNFRTLNYLENGHVEDVKAYVGDSIRYMTVDEIIAYYDFLLHSKYGNEIMEGILEEVKTNPQIAPEVKAYFEARLKEKESREKAARKQAKKAAKRGESVANEKQ